VELELDARQPSTYGGGNALQCEAFAPANLTPSLECLVYVFLIGDARNKIK